MVGGGEPKPPPYPARLRAVIYGFAHAADQIERGRMKA